MKELLERTISNEVVDQLVPESIKVIGFAESGAQGFPEYVIVLSDEGTRICRDEGHFSFVHNGERYGGGVSIEHLCKVAPFLKDFLGNSIESTKRGHFKFENGEWVHLDARFGNHFFIRSNMIKEFIERFEKIPDAYIAQEGLDVAIDMLRGGRENQDADKAAKLAKEAVLAGVEDVEGLVRDRPKQNITIAKHNPIAEAGAEAPEHVGVTIGDVVRWLCIGVVVLILLEMLNLAR